MNAKLWCESCFCIYSPFESSLLSSGISINFIRDLSRDVFLYNYVKCHKNITKDWPQVMLWPIFLLRLLIDIISKNWDTLWPILLSCFCYAFCYTSFWRTETQFVLTCQSYQLPRHNQFFDNDMDIHSHIRNRGLVPLFLLKLLILDGKSWSCTRYVLPPNQIPISAFLCSSIKSDIIQQDWSSWYKYLKTTWAADFEVINNSLHRLSWCFFTQLVFNSKVSYLACLIVDG